MYVCPGFCALNIRQASEYLYLENPFSVVRQFAKSIVSLVKLLALKFGAGCRGNLRKEPLILVRPEFLWRNLDLLTQCDFFVRDDLNRGIFPSEQNESHVYDFTHLDILTGV